MPEIAPQAATMSAEIRNLLGKHGIENPLLGTITSALHLEQGFISLNRRPDLDFLFPHWQVREPQYSVAGSVRNAPLTPNTVPSRDREGSGGRLSGCQRGLLFDPHQSHRRPVTRQNCHRTESHSIMLGQHSAQLRVGLALLRSRDQLDLQSAIGQHARNLASGASRRNFHPDRQLGQSVPLLPACGLRQNAGQCDELAALALPPSPAVRDQLDRSDQVPELAANPLTRNQIRTAIKIENQVALPDQVLSKLKVGRHSGASRRNFHPDRQNQCPLCPRVRNVRGS